MATVLRSDKFKIWEESRLINQLGHSLELPDLACDNGTGQPTRLCIWWSESDTTDNPLVPAMLRPMSDRQGDVNGFQCRSLCIIFDM